MKVYHSARVATVSSLFLDDWLDALSGICSKEQLDSLKVFNNAFLISKDTIGDSDGFNQIKGQRLIGLFKDNELYNVDIIKNAEKIYYSYNEKQELVGIDKSKSGLINILIQDNAIEEVRKINQIDSESEIKWFIYTRYSN